MRVRIGRAEKQSSINKYPHPRDNKLYLLDLLASLYPLPWPFLPLDQIPFLTLFKLPINGLVIVIGR